MNPGGKNWFTKTKPPKGIKVERTRGLAERLDDWSEAVALAEAGEPDLADQVVRPRGLDRRKILVLSAGPGFAPSLVEYAFELAGRMDSAVILLSVGRVPAHPSNTRALNEYLCEEFARTAAEAAAPFLATAGRKGVACLHEVRFGGLESAIDSLRDQYSRIDLALSEPGEASHLTFSTPVPLFIVG